MSRPEVGPGFSGWIIHYSIHRKCPVKYHPRRSSCIGVGTVLEVTSTVLWKGGSWASIPAKLSGKEHKEV